MELDGVANKKMSNAPLCGELMGTMTDGERTGEICCNMDGRWSYVLRRQTCSSMSSMAIYELS